MAHILIITLLIFLCLANSHDLQLANENRSLDDEQNYQSFKFEILRSISRNASKMDNALRHIYFHCRDPQKIEDCDDINKGGYSKSGSYDVCFFGKVISIFCDFETPDGPYIAFQRRMDGSINFFRSFVSYANGFGDITKEFWLGLETIHKYTTNRRYSLRVDLEDFELTKKFATYKFFSVSSASSNYTLTVNQYNGDAGDSMNYHNAMPFSTYEREKDPVLKLAKTYMGAWWYSFGHTSNLNGMYLEGLTDQYATGVVWYHWRGYYYSLKRTEMKMKRI